MTARLRVFVLLSLSAIAVGATAARGESASPPQASSASPGVDVDDGAREAEAEANTDWQALDERLRYVLTGRWIDPPGAFWEPRRGGRTEISLFFGGEAALGELGTLDQIPSIGGTTLTGVVRYYPVDRLAIALGTKGYLGLAEPAAGSTAETVLTPFAGVRWDLVRENRFSLLADVYSGPALFLFADVLGALGAAWAVGGEAQAAATLRYSLGPWTAELRGFVGGRVGEAQEIGRPSFDVGPFSALYAGADLGITWSFWAENMPDPPSEGSALVRK